jgi:hypothetical protein
MQVCMLCKLTWQVDLHVSQVEAVMFEADGTITL